MPRLLLACLIAMPLMLSGCKSESRVEQAPAPEDKPIVTEETRAEDQNVKAEVESICQALEKCWLSDEAGEPCEEKNALSALTLKSPYARGLRDRLISSNAAKKEVDELQQNARGLGATCDLAVKAPEER